MLAQRIILLTLYTSVPFNLFPSVLAPLALDCAFNPVPNPFPYDFGSIYESSNASDPITYAAVLPPEIQSFLVRHPTEAVHLCTVSAIYTFSTLIFPRPIFVFEVF